MPEKNDHYYMALAMQLAARGRCSTMPNPAVGCVIVKDGEIIGKGWHKAAGGPHAEINALTDIIAKTNIADTGVGTSISGVAQGATAYVSLEPCCHEGRTSACTNALLEAGVSRVVAAMQDPNPKVAGKGLDILQQAGVETSCGLMQSQAEKLNRGFCYRMKYGRPFVTAKIAMSLDGRTAMANGESQWITSQEARKEVQALRHCSSAIMTGRGTVIKDDPQLTRRNDQGENADNQPIRVILDSDLQVSPEARILKGAGRKMIFTCGKTDESGDFAKCHGVDIVAAPGADGQVDLGKVLQELAKQEVNDVLLESGAVLNGAMLRAGLVDEIVIFMAPKLMGNNARGLFDLPGLDNMSDSININITDIRAIGQDWRITATVEYN